MEACHDFARTRGKYGEIGQWIPDLVLLTFCEQHGGDTRHCLRAERHCTVSILQQLEQTSRIKAEAMKKPHKPTLNLAGPQTIRRRDQVRSHACKDFMDFTAVGCYSFSRLLSSPQSQEISKKKQ